MRLAQPSSAVLLTACVSWFPRERAGDLSLCNNEDRALGQPGGAQPTPPARLLLASPLCGLQDLWVGGPCGASEEPLPSSRVSSLGAVSPPGPASLLLLRHKQLSCEPLHQAEGTHVGTQTGSPRQEKVPGGTLGQLGTGSLVPVL